MSLFRPGSRWARAYPRFFKLDESQNEPFLIHLRVAALFHDIGKANQDFQAAMMARGFKAQSLRHEHLSALLLCEPVVSSWLRSNPDIDQDIITAAVLSHHLKAAESGRLAGAPTATCDSDATVLRTLPRCARHSRGVATIAGIPPFSGCFPASRYVDNAWSWQEVFDRGAAFKSSLRREREAIGRDPPRLRLCPLAREGGTDRVRLGVVGPLARGAEHRPMD